MEMGDGYEKLYVGRDGRKMALGYTTGSCAAAAAKGAALLLLSGTPPRQITLPTPKGILLHLVPRLCRREGETAVCAVRKDAGDDPDVTDKILIYARVSRSENPGITLEGGLGVGRVTRPGLSQPVGAAAINPAPQKMIKDAVVGVCEDYGYEGGLLVEISAPEGVALAARTLNPELGIEGGISILGTSGIVEPMSEAAYVAAIRVNLEMLAASGVGIFGAAPGNYGSTYLREHLAFPAREIVTCSNFIGDTMDMAGEMGFSGMILAGHIGKLVKLAGGMFNTHSRYGDCRMELLASCSLRAGAGRKTAMDILECVTTDAALDVMKRDGICESAVSLLLAAIDARCRRRTDGRTKVGIVVFSREYGELGRTKDVDALLAARAEK